MNNFAHLRSTGAQPQANANIGQDTIVGTLVQRIIIAIPGATNIEKYSAANTNQIKQVLV